MKTLLLSVCMLACGFVTGQNIYHFIATNGAWTNASSWLPQRNSPASDDILIFNADVTVSDLPASEIIGKLRITDNAKVYLSSTSSATIQIGHGTLPSPHFSVDGGCTLTIGGTQPVQLSIETGFTGQVSGSITVSGNAHRLTAKSANSLFFKNGSVFTAETGFSGNAFGDTFLNTVVFESGATYIFKAGASPFGAAAPETVTNFLPGSIYIHRANSPTPSFAGRTYGHLYIDANVNFAGIGSNRDCIIQNDLRLLSGNFHFKPNTINTHTGHFYITGNIICEGSSSIDIGNDNMTGAVHLDGVNQIVGSGGGSGTINIHHLTNNNSTTSLQRPLTVTGTLNLQNGNIKTNLSSALLTLSPGAVVESCVHSYNHLPYSYMGCNQSYIDGPVRKLGLINQSFAFPVGINGIVRPIIVNNATGDFTAEYHRGDPRTDVGSGIQTGIHHISGLEYWSLSGNGTTAIELSFIDPNSGGVTEMASLRVARYNGTAWGDVGSAGYKGSAGANGSVTSNMLSEFGYFTLAGATGYPNNPLPDKDLSCRAEVSGHTVNLSWAILQDEYYREYIVERSVEGDPFTIISNPIVPLSYEDRRYSFVDQHPVTGYLSYRIRMKTSQNKFEYSRSATIFYPGSNPLIVYPNPASEKISIKIPLSSSRSELEIVNISGLVVKKLPTGGSSDITINIASLPKGVYYIRFKSAHYNSFIKFLKF